MCRNPGMQLLPTSLPSVATMSHLKQWESHHQRGQNYPEKILPYFDLCLTLRAIFWKCQRYHWISRMTIKWKPRISLSGLFQLEHHVLPWHTSCQHIADTVHASSSPHKKLQLSISLLLLGKTVFAGGFRTLSELVRWLRVWHLRMIGVAGSTASGKSTVCKTLVDMVGQSELTEN